MSRILFSLFVALVLGLAAPWSCQMSATTENNAEPQSEQSGPDGGIELSGDRLPADESTPGDLPPADDTTPDNPQPPDQTPQEPGVDAGPEALPEIPTEPSPETPTESTSRKTVFGGNRPATLKVPQSFDPNQTYPLLVVLHGYGATGAIQSAYLGLDQLADLAGVLVIAPDGVKDATGRQFWNATKACCNYTNNGVDDVAYLRGLVEEIQQSYKVDPKRIYFAGHSNGGFMSYRMACEASDLIAGIASLAGATFNAPQDCTPSNPVHILQIHGTNDTTILYNGGNIFNNPYPSAQTTVETWASYNQCNGQLANAQATYDLETNLAGDETKERIFAGCPNNGDVRLWTIEMGSHIPAVNANFAAEVWKWMQAHPKP